MKRILISGGAGFIGSHLCERLLDEGNDVICIDNYFTGHKSNIRHLLKHPNFEVIRHDIIYPYMAEVEEIYNLACPASPIYYQHDPVKTTQTSVIGAMNMLGHGALQPRQGLAGFDLGSIRRPAGTSADRGLLGTRESAGAALVLRRGQTLCRVASS